jgi:hypothetical protein
MDLREVITGNRPTAEAPMAGQDPNNPSSIDLRGRSSHIERNKRLVLDAAAVCAAAAFGFSYYGYLTHGYPVWVLLAMLTLFAAIFALGVFIIDGVRHALVLALLESLAAIAFFWRIDWRVLLVTGGITFVFLIWGHFSGRHRIENSITVPFLGSTGTALGKFTTGALIFMILIYVPKVNGNPLVVSEKSFGTFFDWAANVVNDFYPSVSLHGTFGSFSESIARMELANNPSFQNLSPDAQKAVVSQQTKQFEATFLGNASSTVVASSSASDAFYNVLQGMAGAWQTEAGGWFLIGWIAVVFIALRSIGVVFNWIAQFVTLMGYELLLATGFIKVHEEEHIREVIALS